MIINLGCASHSDNGLGDLHVSDSVYWALIIAPRPLKYHQRIGCQRGSLAIRRRRGVEARNIATVKYAGYRSDP